MITVKIWLGNLLVALVFGGLLVASALRDADLDFPLNALAIAGAIIATTSVGMFGRHLAMTGRKHRAVLAARPHKALKRPRRCHAKLIGVGVVIPFEVGEPIHIVDRQAVRALQPRG